MSHTVFQRLLDRVSAATGMPTDKLAGLLRPPPKSDMGDYALPCFELAKAKGVPPPKCAQDLAAQLADDAPLIEYFETPIGAGPFLNFRAKPGRLSAAILDEVLRAQGRFGLGQDGVGKTIVVDFSSPNIAKPFHVGHLMSTVLGASLTRIFRALGYNVVGVNHLGDWGTQCGYQFLAWQKAEPIQREKRLTAEGLDYLADLYVEINAPAKRLKAIENELMEPQLAPEDRKRIETERAEAKPLADELETQARALFKKLEDGDPELKALWERFRRTTLDVLQKSYDRLGVKFDSDAGEGFYEPWLKPLVRDLKAKGVLVESEGALVIPMEEPGSKKKKMPFIVVKSDGATKYETRDLAAAIYRKKTYDFAQNLYVVDVRQGEHFSNLFKAIEKCGHPWAKDCHHVSYGMMKIKEGDSVLPMTTRGGRMIPLSELLDRMVGVVREIVEQKNPELPSVQKGVVAEAVGVGAIVFWIQARRRTSDITFDWKQATSPDGDTGPYVQYTYARACSILRKARAAGVTAAAAPDLSLLREPQETTVAKTLASFPETLRQAATVYEPSVIATWLLETSRAFNDFYNTHQVLKAENTSLRDARLALVDAVRGALAQGLGLLGVSAPEEM
jgi:arginyl-tRNA synthetase